MKDKFGNIVVGGFILALVCAGLSVIPGLGFILWGAVLGIIPFCVVSFGALVYSLHGLFTGRK